MRFFKSLLLTLIFFLAAPLLAADRNLTADSADPSHNVCERLLEADLSGNYVVTNQKTKQSALIQLRKLGTNSAYTVSNASLHLVAEGIRELEFNRNSQGWLIGDPHAPERRVNVMSVERDGRKIVLNFEDVNDRFGFTYSARPTEDKMTIQGDILRPDAWIVDFNRGFDGEVHFTRIKLDKAFEMVVSQPLKSLLATRLDGENVGIGDYVISVEMKRPMGTEEAREILGTDFVYPFEDVAGENVPHYRFAVPKSVFELLESIGRWTRHWEVNRVDAVSARTIHPDLLTEIVSLGSQLKGPGHEDEHDGVLDQLKELKTRYLPSPQPPRVSENSRSATRETTPEREPKASDEPNRY